MSKKKVSKTARVSKVKKEVRLLRTQTGDLGIFPLFDKVLIKEFDKNEKNRVTDYGIIIPDSVSEDKGAKRGKVVAVGEGKYEDGKLIPMSVKKGDKVLFSWGDEIKINGEEYQIVSETSILAILK
ncbi:co-chaperone GroES [Patescibacteria group bacterium]|nr:co-chaperone GroES [Patescibacteria group bacterium]MBU4057500.1 co-chaperone GroES [Patescibacteria group bacterium]MBU4116034.1 co-chaperone GroES [Patescibacteria group bacterium]